MNTPKGFFKPTKEQLKAAQGKTLPDILRPNLKILFIGINPGLYTAAIGHHFGRPGNRFWPALHAGGLTPRQFSPFDEKELLPLGIGITNVFSKATAAAAEVTEKDFIAGGKNLEKKIKKVDPRVAAFLGLGAYRSAFGMPKATVGLQEKKIGKTRIWALPNPSGLNANYQAKDFARLFREVGKDAGIIA